MTKKRLMLSCVTFVLAIGCGTIAYFLQDLIVDAGREPDEIADKLTPENFERYIRLAQFGIAKAQVIVGLGYIMGEGTVSNPKEAFRWIAQSADQGNVEGLIWRGYLQADGIGTKQDPAAALQSFQAAAVNNDPRGMYSLAHQYYTGFTLKRNTSEYLRLMRRAAEAGYAPAQSHLGGILLTSPYRVEPGIPPNDTEALKWLRQATAQNDFNGLTTLSECYLEGRAVPKDYAEGVRLLRKALDCSGLPYSSYYPDKLSKLYQEGKGVPKDLTLAYMWKLIALAAWKDDDSGRAAAQATSEELEASLTRSELLAAQGHATKWWEERIR